MVGSHVICMTMELSSVSMQPPTILELALVPLPVELLHRLSLELEFGLSAEELDDQVLP